MNSKLDYFAPKGTRLLFDQLLVRKTSPLSNSLQNAPGHSLERNCAQTINDFDISGSQHYQHDILRTMEYIKEQNNQILNILNNQRKDSGNRKTFSLFDIPVQLPISSDIDLLTMEEFLKLEKNRDNIMFYLSSLGGEDVISHTNKCLHRLLTRKFTCNFSLLGKPGSKKAFCNLTLNKCILDAVTRNWPQANDFDVVEAIRVWLKDAPQRYRNHLLNKRNSNQPC